MKVAHRMLVTAGFGVILCGVGAAQQSAAPPRPAPGRLAAIGPARPNRGNIVDKPANAAPTAPAGFTVQLYAELQAPRMMVYAPNGDLFVSSRAANNITVLRDVGQDGCSRHGASTLKARRLVRAARRAPETEPLNQRCRPRKRL